jgi:hypothetical protein
MIVEAYTTKLVISKNEYKKATDIYDGIISTFGAIYKTTTNFDARSNKLAYLIFDYITKTNDTVILSGQDSEKKNTNNYLKLNRSSFKKMKLFYDRENAFDIEGETYNVGFGKDSVNIINNKHQSITVAKEGDGSNSLTTQQQENFVCTVINYILSQNIDWDELLRQYNDTNKFLALVLSALELDESSDIAKKIKNSAWHNSFLGTCKVILELLEGKTYSDYQVKRIDDTVGNATGVVKTYLDLVDVLRKPLNQNRNNITTADILLYNKNEQQSADLIKKITDSVQDQIKDNNTVNSVEKSDAQLKEVRKSIKEQLIGLWKEHGIVGISLKKTNKNAGYQYCNFDANIDAKVVVFGYDIDVKENRTSIYIKCDEKIVKETITNTKDENGNVVENIDDKLSKDILSTDDEQKKKFILKGKTTITIRSFGNNNFGADIKIGKSPTLGKVQANTYRRIFNKLINNKEDTSKVQYSTVKQFLASIQEDNPESLNSEFAKLIASGIKVNNFALPFILIK